ncbi:YfiR family protein [Caulobacter sp. 1776]|uniref:YfiR family protein n=1 Tax=Caulobacter sp. 1776 TaxID=3156420 RepID=UPI00339A0367
MSLLAGLALYVGLAGSARAGDVSLEYAVKANYLYKFTPFVEWPPTAFETPSSPFNLCVVGRDPFGVAMDRAVGGRRVADHPVMVIRLPVVAKGTACHMLFLGRSRVQTPQQALAAVAGQPVLTVADRGLNAKGAMVQFIMVDGRVRFEIRSDAVQAGGLVLSSKLQALSAPQKGDGR